MIELSVEPVRIRKALTVGDNVRIILGVKSGSTRLEVGPKRGPKAQ